MRLHLLQLTALVVVLLSLSGTSLLAAERPTPLEWEQWQPQLDRSDVRLREWVSVWEEEITLEDLFARVRAEEQTDLGSKQSPFSDEGSRQVASSRTCAVANALSVRPRGCWINDA